MSTRTKQAQAARKTHDRSATIQWFAIGLMVVVAMVAILVLTEGSSIGGHGGALTLLQP